MRRLIALMSVVVMVFVVSFPVMAANESAALVFPGLSFSGTTATCSLEVYAEHATDAIVATVKLKHGNSVVKQWTNLTDIGILDFSDTAGVSHGETYTLQVTLTINGSPYPVADVTRVCP